jgi:hypothetical protein
MEFDDTNNSYSFSNGGGSEHHSAFNNGGDDIDTPALERALDRTKDEKKQLETIAQWVAAMRAERWRSADIEYEARRAGDARDISRKKMQQAIDHGHDLWAGIQYEKDLQDLGLRLGRDIGAANPAEAQAQIDRLAKLPKLEYAQAKKASAKELGIGLKELEGLVKEARGSGGDTKGQGHAFEMPQIEPWPQPVNGAECLDEVVNQIERYVIMPEGAAEVGALWIMHTHCFDCFTHSPRMAIRSPEKQCGKTTALDVISCLVARALPTSNATPSAIFRIVEKHSPTLLIDEADTFLKDNDELRGVLNTGHRKGGTVIRTVGDDHEPRLFSTWAPVAIAMIGRLPDTLADRSIDISLRRRKSTEKVQSFRSDRAQHLAVLASKMARWAKDNAEALSVADPDTGEMQNRVADNWRPLLAIADVAGGDWPKGIRRIAIAAHKAAEDQSIRVMSLADIKTAFDSRNANCMRSEDLAAYLGDMEERPWPEYGKSGKRITQNAIAKLLKPFGISPNQKRLGDKNHRGYELSHFDEAFEIYLSPEGPSKPLRCYEPNNDADCSASPTATPKNAVADEKSQKSLPHSDCSGVAVQNLSPDDIDDFLDQGWKQ